MQFVKAVLRSVVSVKCVPLSVLPLNVQKSRRHPSKAGLKPYGDTSVKSMPVRRLEMNEHALNDVPSILHMTNSQFLNVHPEKVVFERSVFEKEHELNPQSAYVESYRDTFSE